MRKRWIVFLILLLLFLGLALLLPPVQLRLIGWARNEKFYDGRPISYWRNQLKQDWSEDDPSWLERLEETLDWLGIVDREMLMAKAAAVPMLIELLHDEDPLVCVHACRSLELIGPEAKEAIPALEELLKSDKVASTPFEDLPVRKYAENALMKIDPQGTLKKVSEEADP